MPAVMAVPVMVAAAAHATADMRAGAVTDRAASNGANRATHKGAGTGTERAIDQALLRLDGARGPEEARRDGGHG